MDRKEFKIQGFNEDFRILEISHLLRRPESLEKIRVGVFYKGEKIQGDFWVTDSYCLLDYSGEKLDSKKILETKKHLPGETIEFEVPGFKVWIILGDDFEGSILDYLKSHQVQVSYEKQKLPGKFYLRGGYLWEENFGYLMEENVWQYIELNDFQLPLP